VPRTICYPEIPLHAIGWEAARERPHGLAVYFVQENRKYTYLELMHHAARIAAALSDLGVGPGDGVALYMTNSPEFLFTVYGVSMTGAFIVPINPMSKAADIEHIIRDCGRVKVVVCTSFLYLNIEKVQATTTIERVIVEGAEVAGTLNLDDLMARYPARPPRVQIDPRQDLCVLLYTGGTTGAPKGVMLTHYNITTNVFQMAGTDPYPPGREINDSCVTVLPMCHAFGFSQVQLYIAQKALMILYNGFDPPEVMRLIEAYHTENFVGIPLMFQLLVNDPGFEDYDLTSLIRVISGAASLPRDLARKWKETVGSNVGQGYGMSEAGPTSHMTPIWLDDFKDSIGVPVVDTDVRIVDPEERNREMSPGEIGEFAVRGPQIMQGYWNRPDLTAKTVVDGWLMTGDLGRMDERGLFYIAGRSTDMIKYKGYKVLPDDVEDALHRHPAVLECGVVGVPDPEIGETIKAFVVLKAEYHGGVTEADLQAWAREEMAGYKWPRIIEFIDRLPRTAVGKVFRRELRDRK